MAVVLGVVLLDELVATVVVDNGAIVVLLGESVGSGDKVEDVVVNIEVVVNTVDVVELTNELLDDVTIVVVLGLYPIGEIVDSISKLPYYHYCA